MLNKLFLWENGLSFRNDSPSANLQHVWSKISHGQLCYRYDSLLIHFYGIC